VLTKEGSKLLIGNAITNFQAIVGSLQYAATVTRPDISVATKMLSRFVSCPTEVHLCAAKRVIRYLSGTAKLGLRYSPTSWLGTDTDKLVAYCDADFAGDTDTRRSTSGYIVFFNGGPVTWFSKLQSIVTLSSCESEYVALSLLAQELSYSRSFLEELGFKQDGPTLVLEDNQGAIALTHNHGWHARTKHIAVRWHYIREAVDQGLVALEYIPTEIQVADVLTKALPKTAFCIHREKMLGMSQ
jgi:hypothetical protein